MAYTLITHYIIYYVISLIIVRYVDFEIGGVSVIILYTLQLKTSNKKTKNINNNTNIITYN